MEDSPHWHPARWPRDQHKKLSGGIEAEYFRFRVDYLFRFRLGCRTREDVIGLVMTIVGVFVGVLVGVFVGVFVGVLVKVLVGVTVGV